MGEGRKGEGDPRGNRGGGVREPKLGKKKKDTNAKSFGEGQKETGES